MSQAAMWDAFYLLQKVEQTLKTAAGQWWRGPQTQNVLLNTSTELESAYQSLTDTEIEMDPELLERSGRWGTGEASAADILDDRDAIIGTMAVIRFVIDRDGLEQEPPRHTSGDGEGGWKPVRLPRASIKKVTGAG